MRFNSDIDIDTGDRDKLLSLIEHTKASIRKSDVKKHNTGIYITNIPYDPINDISAHDYEVAEERGYFKLDILNVHVYKQVKSEEHRVELMKEPDWNKLSDSEFVSK